jgi:hypothetical protein
VNRLSKEVSKVFFSEEKKQKTFISSPASRWVQGNACGAQPEDKSLLVLFFRKEHSYFLSKAH